jgi:hypothetical protein
MQPTVTTQWVHSPPTFMRGNHRLSFRNWAYGVWLNDFFDAIKRQFAENRIFETSWSVTEPTNGHS